MTALTEEKLNMIVGGLETASDEPDWERELRVDLFIISEMYKHHSRKYIYHAVCKRWGENSFEAEYAKKRLQL